MSKSREAFTLLEVLCATALASLLMVGVLGVIGGLAKTEQALARNAPRAEWRRRLVQQIGRDLSGAERFEPIENGFLLSGPIGVDLATGVADWKRVRVTYTLEPSPLGGALLRSEAPQGLTRDPEIRVLAIGVESMAVGSPGVPLPATTGGDPDVVISLEKGAPPYVLRLVCYGEGKVMLLDELVSCQ